MKQGHKKVREPSAASAADAAPVPVSINKKVGGRYENAPFIHQHVEHKLKAHPLSTNGNETKLRSVRSAGNKSEGAVFLLFRMPEKQLTIP